MLYFYQQAIERAGDDEVVDIEQFTYPGPRPQTKETAILMLADSSEAAVRSRKPTKKQDTADTIQQIFDTKIRTGQLDKSGLTLNDIKLIRKIFADMLQAVFHPRISYPGQQQPAAQKDAVPADAQRNARKHENTPGTMEAVRIAPADDRSHEGVSTATTITVETARPQLEANEVAPVKITLDDGDAPLPNVPPLPRTGDHKAVKTGENGKLPPAQPTEEQAG